MSRSHPQVRQFLSAISAQNRATTGVKLQRLDADDLVASAVVVPAADEDEAGQTDAAEEQEPGEARASGGEIGGGGESARNEGGGARPSGER